MAFHYLFLYYNTSVAYISQPQQVFYQKQAKDHGNPLESYKSCDIFLLRH
jgi:hypothetical protein